MKSGYEPGQTAGINTFSHYGELITILHPGAHVPSLTTGQILLLRRSDNLYWCGRVYNNEFMFLLGNAVPVPVEAVFDFLRAAWIVDECHRDADFLSQGDLPF